MIKKIVSLAGAGLMLLGMSAPAFAYYGSSALIRVHNSATSYADTGNNLQGNFLGNLNHVGIGSISGGGDNTLHTGDANSTANANTTVNSTVNLGGYEWLPRVVKVSNDSYSSAETGYNIQGNSTGEISHAGIGTLNIGGNNTLTTGNANTTANAATLVNVTVNSGEIL